MDTTDLVLCQALLVNSRISFHDLADRFNLSVPAVHRRIQALRRAGVIRGFTARLSLPAVGAGTVLLIGRTEAPSFEEAYAGLEHEGHVYWVAVAGGNYLYVGTYLRDLSELDGVVARVGKAARMPDMTVAIIGGFQPPRLEELTLLDFRIIQALHEDSRRTIADVAEEVGVSAKTTARRLDRLSREGLVEMSLKWHPDTEDSNVTVFHLHVRSPDERPRVVAVLMNRYAPNALFAWTFSNLPNLVAFAVWTPDMKTVTALQAKLRAEPLIESVVPNVLYSGVTFDTWRDELLKSRAQKARRA